MEIYLKYRRAVVDAFRHIPHVDTVRDDSEMHQITCRLSAEDGGQITEDVFKRVDVVEAIRALARTVKSRTGATIPVPANAMLPASYTSHMLILGPVRFVSQYYIGGLCVDAGWLLQLDVWYINKGQ